LDYHHVVGIDRVGDVKTQMKNLRDKSVLVLGLGETGISLVRWLSAQGAKVQVADSRTLPPGLAELTENYPQVAIHRGAFRNELLAGIELIAISPGVPLAEPFVQQALARQIPVVGDIELFAQSLPQNNPSKSSRLPAPMAKLR